MLNNPRSRLIEKMEYYIKPEQEETDYLRINKPEEIKVCDPACGSGHMLTYAFDLLYEIYEEQGYDPVQIPILILQSNLYGIEIDKRAGDLASFALVMKARGKSRSFLAREIKPNVMVLENIDIDEAELSEYIKHVGRDSFTLDVLTTIRQFKDAKLFGSLIIPEEKDPSAYIEEFKMKQLKDEFFQVDVHDGIIKALEQAEYLSQRYHVVVTNPPYMGGNANQRLADFSKGNYPNSKSDLCTMFIERNLQMAVKHGYVAMITMQSWMFLSSYEKLREHLIDSTTILSMAHLGTRAFDSIGGEVVSTTGFVIKSPHYENKPGIFLRLVDGKSEEEKAKDLKLALSNPNCGWFFKVSADEFKKIPGSPIAYWISNKLATSFSTPTKFEDIFLIKAGISTGDNNRFILFWPEVSISGIRQNANRLYIYVPHNKGGAFRRWIGNQDYVLKYSTESIKAMQNNLGFRHDGKEQYFTEHVGWSKIASGKTSFRYYDNRFSFDSAGLALFGAPEDLTIGLAFLNSKVVEQLIAILNPTLNVTPQIIKTLPWTLVNKGKNIVKDLIRVSKLDWDSCETSWDFTSLPLLEPSYRANILSATYTLLRSHWKDMALKMKGLEEENNRIFIESYGLEEELTPEVPLEEITLTCNPRYRYRGNKSDEELEALLLADTMKEFISYAVGCMFGRYSLDKPGLILANQGDTYEDYKRIVPESSFPADKNNAIPILDGDWFADDIVSRFRRFLRVTFGDNHFEANLKFLEQAIGKDIRQYFLKDFYNDHVQRYKKRPIYWMFSSPDGSFNVLIYMHRYNPDTVSIVRNEYLREYMSKLTGHIVNLQAQETNMSLTKGERICALKEIDKIKKIYDGLEKYEQDVIFPLATQRIEIDLDDGVRVNYPKFGAALKKIAGLEAKDEE